MLVEDPEHLGLRGWAVAATGREADVAPEVGDDGAGATAHRDDGALRSIAAGLPRSALVPSFSAYAS